MMKSSRTEVKSQNIQTRVFFDAESGDSTVFLPAFLYFQGCPSLLLYFNNGKIIKKVSFLIHIVLKPFAFVLPTIIH